MAGHVLGWLLARTGQPAVIGEILAGIALGPSLLQRVAPDWATAAVPTASLPHLALVAQIVTALYMLLAGLEIDLREVRSRARTALLVAPWTVAVPFALGFGLAAWLPSVYRGPAGSGPSFGVFLGAALAITAFPVLLRLLRDRALLHTPLGATAITCATVNDVAVWTILAIVLGQSGGAAGQVVFVALAVGIALSGQRALVHRLTGALTAPVTLLLPVVFVVSGLRTDITAISTAAAWTTCVGITLLATAGTMGGAAVAARIQGQPWRDALRLGALLNTRGLMGLVLLNAGLDRGLITPELFSMLVIMALVTTAATAPLLAALPPALQSRGAGSSR